MKKSVLLVMLDVMVLSVLALTSGQQNGASGLLLPVYQWSQLIEKGLEKEKDYEVRLANMKSEMDKAREEASRAKQFIDQQKEFQDTTLSQLEKAAQQQHSAEEQMQQALKQTRQAEMEAQLATEQKRIAEQQADAAQALREQAELQAAVAQQEAQKALIQAEVAKQQQQKALQQLNELSTQTKQIQQQSSQKELTTATLTEKLAALEKQRIEREAEMAAIRQREELARQKAETAEQQAAALQARTEMAEKQLDQMNNRIDASRQYITRLRDTLTTVKVAEQKVKTQLDSTMEQKQQLEQKLEEIEQEQNRSVWVQRDEAMALLSFSITNRDHGSGDSQTQTELLYYPLVQMGSETIIPTDFYSLGLNSWQIQYARDITDVSATICNIYSNTLCQKLNRSILSLPEEPAICLIPLIKLPPNLVTRPLDVAGMAYIKQNRIQQALAFSPANPDKSLPVQVTPTLNNNFLITKPVKNSSIFSRRPLNRGDYLLTDKGRFIGIMIDTERCFVLPDSFPDTSTATQIPLLPTLSTKPYSTFIDQARTVKNQL